MSDTAPSDFTRLRRMHQRGVYDRAAIHAILDATTVSHVGHVIGDRPVVTPTFHWREGDSVYWHGSSASRTLRANRAGGAVCLTATALDGFVLARSAFHHSANYRSVMCFGIPRLVDDEDEKLAAMRGFVDRLFPGRWALLRPVTAQEVRATSILALTLDEASAKVRTGPPGDDDEDLSWPVWGGVVPVTTALGAPEPDKHLVAGVDLPVTALVAA